MKYEEQLRKMFANINDWLKFAEAKNLGLLTLSAAVVFGFTKVNFDNSSAIEKIGYYILIPFAILSFICALISLIPILSNIEKSKKIKGSVAWLSNKIDEEKIFVNIHFYGYLQSLKADEFETEYLTKVGLKEPFNEFERDLVIQILYNSRITWLKYQIFKIGASFFLLGVVIFTIILVLYSAFHAAQ